jgi:hypothetical protein
MVYTTHPQKTSVAQQQFGRQKVRDSCMRKELLPMPSATHMKNFQPRGASWHHTIHARMRRRLVCFPSAQESSKTRMSFLFDDVYSM